MAHELIAVVEKGMVCHFTICMRDDTGLAIGHEESDGSFAPTYFDVIRNSTQEVVLLDQPLQTKEEGEYGQGIYFGQFDTNYGQFVAGEQYTLLLKEVDGTAPTRFCTRGVSVTAPASSYLQCLIDRITYLRNVLENVHGPRLKRALGLLGENYLVDQWVYDPSGNIERQRVRLFDTAENCNRAHDDIEDDSLPEIGEIATYWVVQENDRPRCVRTLRRCAPDSDATDATVTPNTAITPVYAPGNEGGWPAI